ncbi:alpha/beta hydrolase [Mycolicibacterium austroafricanum]|jgi:pimeloyl-ACP methyl ester carboxylesterase|uniref:Alpha/beta fold hydrolase n=1 Tax=Mycolicibacterium austroafricanum TaxID=39687 RepID=A0ABT8HMV4_MYCAO|nr:alpha/beta fold hydrolase [Mycolicibacterium austroafricanum]MDN4522078.1 alpha/beta fold hydrolase [Mycolicibacterium austroafricanum]PQP43179.1 alpha/beta hydrolase [Mycolicibacterium austroafricanum]QRZ05676.1 alpha/beta fold hydrolase [Mycolicibacterium austroafricanum]QZT67232.1 alpha/beta hydrolase [Mycolicibacterium austroafricanum]
MPRFCSVAHDGAHIRYLDSGGDDLGAPIVFVPGFTDVADDYIETLPAFGRRAAVVELRGHGHSRAVAGPYDSDTLGRDVGAVIDAVTDGPVHLITFSRGTAYALTWALAHQARVRSLSIGDYVPEEIVLTDEVMLGLLDGRWRGSPVRDRVDPAAAIATVRAARAQSFWEPLARWQPPLLVVRSPNATVVDDAAWARYRKLFPHAGFHEFTDSPHDIFRPDRGRYPALVRSHVDAVDCLPV